MDADDQSLVRAAAAGDRAAFTALHGRHRDLVLRRLSHLLGPCATVDDLVQETFLRAYRALRSFRGEGPVSHWLLRIATRTALEERRRVRRSIWRLFYARAEEDRLQGQVCADAERYPELVAVHAALDRIAPRLRVAVILFELEGRSLTEIAAELELPLATIAARVRRGRAALRKQLERMGYGGWAAARLQLCPEAAS